MDKLEVVVFFVGVTGGVDVEWGFEAVVRGICIRKPLAKIPVSAGFGLVVIG